jgi:hypothetical protein
MAKPSTGRERREFLIGLGSFLGVFLLSYAWVLFVTPIASSAAGVYALISFTLGVGAAIALIFSRLSLVGLGGSLAVILFVVFFAFTWPLFH